MSAITPKAMEATLITEMKDIKPFLPRPRRPCRVYLHPILNSKGKFTEKEPLIKNFVMAEILAVFEPLSEIV